MKKKKRPARKATSSRTRSRTATARSNGSATALLTQGTAVSRRLDAKRAEVKKLETQLAGVLAKVK